MLRWHASRVKQTCLRKRMVNHPMKISNRMQAAARTLMVLQAAAMFGCAPLAPQPEIAAVEQRSPVANEYRPSPNFDHRRANFVILHHTSNDTVETALRVLTQRVPGVSSHYLIGRDGKIFQLVDDRQRAWHAGVSQWGGHRDLNSASIGIEL